MKKLKLMLMGLGKWGCVGFRTLIKMKGIRLYVAEIDKELLEKYKKEFNGTGRVLYTTNYKDFLDKVDAVYIVTPAHTHYSVVKECLSRDVDCLCEKPLTLKREEAEELIALAKKKKKILAVGYKFLFSPLVQRMQRDLLSLGTPYFVDARFTMLKPIREDDGVKGTYACHFLAVLFHLLGSKNWKIVGGKTIDSFVYRKKHEDVSIININNGKTIVNLVVTWLTPSENTQTMRISCPNGGITTKFIHGKEMKQTVEVDYSHHSASGKVMEKTIKHWQYHQDPLLNELNNFITCCKTRKNPINSAEFLELAIQDVIR